MRTLNLLALVALGGWALSAINKTRGQLHSTRSKSKPDALQTWEGEGGGLPDGGPHPHKEPLPGKPAW